MVKNLPSLRSLTLHQVVGEDLELRRAGVIPDVFVSKNGDCFQLVPLTRHLQGKNKVLKYRKTTLPVKYLVADAWNPGWDVGIEDEAHIVPVNGDHSDCSVTNLKVTTMAMRGAPRNSRLYKKLKAVAIYSQHPDAALIAEELGLSPAEVLAAVKQYG